MGWRQKLRNRKTLLAATVCGAAILYFSVSQSEHYQRKRFIEQRYASYIRDLETAMLKWPRKDYTDGWYDTTQSLKDELKTRFDDPAFYDVSWSYDGHHGAEVIKMMPETGYSRHQLIPSTIWQKRSLYSGRSFVGTDLLIYEGWLRNAPEMRHFQIVFRRDRIDHEMNGQITK